MDERQPMVKDGLFVGMLLILIEHNDSLKLRDKFAKLC